MIGDNNTITTYRLARDGTTGKQSWSATPRLYGVPCSIQLERMERAAIIDQANALNIYRLHSDEDLDLQKGDKVLDARGVEYKVHTVQKEPTFNGLSYITICFLTKVSNV